MARKVYVARSGIHGKGVFAGKSFVKGERVGYYRGYSTKVTSEENPFVIEMYDEDEVLTGYRMGTNQFRFVNHSADPNLDMDDDLVFWAVKDIAKDEELTWFYGPEFEADMQKDRLG
jgi:SET domain-containing protein